MVGRRLRPRALVTDAGQLIQIDEEEGEASAWAAISSLQNNFRGAVDTLNSGSYRLMCNACATQQPAGFGDRYAEIAGDLDGHAVPLPIAAGLVVHHAPVLLGVPSGIFTGFFPVRGPPARAIVGGVAHGSRPSTTFSLMRGAYFCPVPSLVCSSQ